MVETETILTFIFVLFKGRRSFKQLKNAEGDSNNFLDHISDVLNFGKLDVRMQIYRVE